MRRSVVIALLLCLPLPSAPCAESERAAGVGKVVAIDEDRAALTLDHGPIPGLMPAMRMQFSVRHQGLLHGLEVGGVVRFSLEPRGAEWIIAAIEPVPAAASARRGIFPAPDFAVSTLSGDSIRLSALRGRVVLLNFWATWCVPCRTEMPSLDALYRRYKDAGLDVVAINLDSLSAAGVQAFVRDVPVTFPIGLDPSWATAHAYRVVGVPTSYLIDRDGNVVVREVGPRDWTDTTSAEAVRRLLE